MEDELERETLSLNLSYVLREPSSSRAVARAVRDSFRFERRRQRLLHHFSGMSDDDLRERIVISPGLASLITSQRDPFTIVTPSLGLYELLPRAVTTAIAADNIQSVARIDSDHPDPDAQPIIFFGTPARFSGLSRETLRDPALIIGLIVRPGGRELMLTGHLIHPSHTRADIPHDYSRVELLEDLIRDFVDQWTPPRPLWDVPAEVANPDILDRFDRTGAR